MISNQILQNTIDGLKGITRIDLCIIDVEGKILAATFPDAEKYVEPAQAFVESPADSQVVNGYQFFKVFDEHQLEYILLANGDSDDVYMVGKIASFQIQNLLVAYKERFDKDNFIKNLLLDNLLLVDIYNRAKKLHIDTEVRRVVFIVETNREKDGNEMEKIRGIFGGKSKDFVTAVDEKNIIVVKEVADERGIRRTGTRQQTVDREPVPCGVAENDVHVALWNNCQRDQRSIPFLQGSPYGIGCRKDFLRGERCDRILHIGNWTSDLSAPDSAVQDVYQRDF